MEYVYENPKYPNFSWSDFVSEWHSKPCLHVKYEDLRQDCLGEMQRIMKNYIPDLDENQIALARLARAVEENEFSKVKSRVSKNRPQNGVSFVRNGKPGEWREVFSNSQLELFNQYTQDSLKKLGYV